MLIEQLIHYIISYNLIKAGSGAVFLPYFARKPVVEPFLSKAGSKAVFERYLA